MKNTMKRNNLSAAIGKVQAVLLQPSRREDLKKLENAAKHELN